MVYNPNEYQEKLLPKQGSKVDAEVTKIVEGTFSDFIPLEVLKSWRGVKPTDHAIQVHFKTQENNFNKVMSLPQDNVVDPRSIMGKWKHFYGSYPAEGQKIYLIADENGNYQLAE